MNRHSRLAALAVVLSIVTGCSDASQSVAPRGLSPRDAAHDVVVNETTPAALVTFNPCNGDLVALTGEMHLVVGTTQSNGGSEHVYYDLSSRYSGVGVPSGVNYTASDGVHNEFVRGNPFPFVSTFFIETKVTSQSGINNYVLRFHIKITVNNRGVPTVEIIDFGSRCGG